MKLIAPLVMVLVLLVGCYNETGSDFTLWRNFDSGTFITHSGSVIFVNGLPDVVTKRTASSAIIGGEIIDISSTYTILQYGHVYEADTTAYRDSTPSIEEFHQFTSFGYSEKLGKFTSKLENLKNKTPYFVRAYVKVRDKNTNQELIGYNPTVQYFETPEIQDYWQVATTYPGKERVDAVSFTLGDFAYVGTGFDGAFSRNDFWKLERETDKWYPAPAIPGNPRKGAVNFIIDGKAYVGLGMDDGKKELQDFYCFDPTKGESGEWEQIAPLPGFARVDAIAFAIGGRGYVVGGSYNNQLLPDVWCYDPKKDEGRRWFNINNDLSESLMRKNASVVILDESAYMCFGERQETYLEDIWEFNAQTLSWTSVMPFPGAGRADAFAFSSGDHLFLGGGKNDAILNDFWAYDPYNKQWIQKNSVGDSEMFAVFGASGFFLGDYGYVVGGQTADGKTISVWSYYP